MKYEINHDQLKELLILQKECSDALDQLSDIGIELEGMKLRIPQYYALLNLVWDILGRTSYVNPACIQSSNDAYQGKPS
jgi:hypothetical protein